MKKDLKAISKAMGEKVLADWEIKRLKDENERLTKENKKLIKENKILKFEKLPKYEQEWAERAYQVMRGEDWEYIRTLESFRLAYIDKKEGDLIKELPFF